MLHKIKFSEFLNEFELDNNLNEIVIKNFPIKSLKDQLPPLNEMKLIYKGNDNKIYMSKNTKFMTPKFFYITDNNDNIIFYQQYEIFTISNSLKIKYYQLLTRENISNSKYKGLFEKLIMALLFLGYPLKDDVQHNLLSLKGIESLFSNDKIKISYNTKSNGEMTYINSTEQLRKILSINDKNISIFYHNAYSNNEDLIQENVKLNYQSQWDGLDLFDDINDWL